MRVFFRDDGGFALITVVLGSFVLIGLVALTLATAERADTTSTSYRNWVHALSVAESGVHDAIEAITKAERAGSRYTAAGTSRSFTGTATGGTYEVRVDAAVASYTIEALGRANYREPTPGVPVHARLSRARRVKVTMLPPRSFTFALMSETTITLGNNDQIDGDMWANDAILVSKDTEIGTPADPASITSARSWIDLEQESTVTGDLWSGGYNSSGAWSVRLANGANINGNAKSSVAAPNCAGENSSNYTVRMANGTSVDELVTYGSRVGGSATEETWYTCTAAAVPKVIPPFHYSATNYAVTPQEFSSVSSFNTYLATYGANLTGVFRITDSAPTQANRINLTGANIVGDTTIITNAPIFANGVSDTSSNKVFVLVTSYSPPANTSCDVNQFNSECAVHLVNNLRVNAAGTCDTAVLVYASGGSVAMKNSTSSEPSPKLCGAVYGIPIVLKNNIDIEYDARVERMVGFGDVRYEVARWEELPP